MPLRSNSTAPGSWTAQNSTVLQGRSKQNTTYRQQYPEVEQDIIFGKPPQSRYELRNEVQQHEHKSQHKGHTSSFSQAVCNGCCEICHSNRVKQVSFFRQEYCLR
jgi:hypothetical protein